MGGTNSEHEPVTKPEQPEREAPANGRVQILTDAYTETGIMYRHFSAWRARLLAGYLVLVVAVAVVSGWAWTHPTAKPMTWIALAVGCLLTLLFWALERRNRQISFVCVSAGSEIERELGISPRQGVFGGLKKLPDVEPTHSRTMDWMYLIAALAFLIGTVYCLAETA